MPGRARASKGASPAPHDRMVRSSVSARPHAVRRTHRLV